MTLALRRGILEVPNSAEAHAALAQLNVRLARLESARLAGDEEILDKTTRALFVNYGAAILSAPEELAPVLENLQNSAGILSYGEINLRLYDLCEWLRQLKVVPRCIFALENLDSQILGRALAHQLGVEMSVADGDSFTRSKSLLVSADNRALSASALRAIFPAQVLYSFNLHHQGGVIVPDVSSLAYAGFELPWQQERLSLGKIPSVVERIVGTSMSAVSPQWPARLEFYRTRRQLLTAGNSTYARSSVLPEII